VAISRVDGIAASHHLEYEVLCFFPLFSFMTQRILVISYRRFRSTYRSQIQV